MGGLGFRVCGLAFGVEAKINAQVSVEGFGEIVRSRLQGEMLRVWRNVQGSVSGVADLTAGGSSAERLRSGESPADLR